MNLDLGGTVVVVLGAASGIGRAIAEGFAKENATVCLLDRNEKVTDVAESISKSGGTTWHGVIDATDFDGLKRQATEIHERFGRLDHAVASIGISSGRFGFPFWNLEPSDWEQTVRVNLLGVVNFAHACVPMMLPKKSGTLCFLASVAGQIGSQTDPPYSAAKAGVINFAQCAAKDLAEYNIRVNVVSPGMVKTSLNRSVWQAWTNSSDEHTDSYDDWGAQKNRAISPLGRWQDASDIADMVVFLASKRAKNITGQTLNVDGGQVMHS